MIAMTTPMNFDWDDLRLLLALSDAGTVARAAELTGLNVTTVPRRIRRLEKRLGIRLIERIKGGVILTAEAQKFAQLARQTNDGLGELFHPVNVPDPVQGTVRISATDFMIDLLAETFAELCKEHPGLVLELKPTNDVLSLANREADIAVRIGDTLTDGLVGRRIGAIPIGIYVAPGQTEVTDPWIGWQLPRGVTVIETVIGQHDPKARAQITVDSFIQQARFLKAGFGSALLPDPWVAARPEFQGLERIADVHSEDAWVVTHEELHGVPRIAAVMKRIATSKVLT